MRTIPGLLFVTVALCASSAFSCPVFNGTYLCKYDGGDVTKTLSTQLVNGSYAYTQDSGLNFIADGKVRPFANDDKVVRTETISATCKGNTLSINVGMKIGNFLSGFKGESDYTCLKEK